MLVTAPLVASVLKRADQALYRAKRDGRNRAVPDPA
jgi:PleD family two-component response regulator